MAAKEKETNKNKNMPISLDGFWPEVFAIFIPHSWECFFKGGVESGLEHGWNFPIKTQSGLGTNLCAF